MNSIPSPPVQVDSNNSDKLPIQPLAVEMLITHDQRRTSRTAPDETEAILSELHRIEEKRKPTP